MTAFDRVKEALRIHGCLKGRGCCVSDDKARAKCPVHGDVRPSLCLTWNGYGVGLYCHLCKKGGTEKIVAALGLTMADLFETRRTGDESRKPVTVAQYRYTDIHGVLIATKIRQHPKAFRWCRPDTSEPDGIAWNLHGVRPGLYRCADLIDCEVVYITEGEKSVDLLWSLGLPATCAPWGAGRWDEQFSVDLYNTGCRQLVVLPDFDRSGAEHADIVARITHSLATDVAITTKVVMVPGLLKKQNAVDKLIAGELSKNELLALVAETPVWTPGATELKRQERRRVQSRDLMRRLRARRRAAAQETDIHMLTPALDISQRVVSTLAVSTVHALQLHSKVMVSEDLGTRLDMAAQQGNGDMEIGERDERSEGATLLDTTLRRLPHREGHLRQPANAMTGPIWPDAEQLPRDN